MKRKTFACLLFGALLSASAWAQTADEIIEKNIQAKGGREKIKAMNTVRMTGKMAMGQGMEAPFTMEMSRPNKMRMEFTLQGMTGVQAYDGTTGWMVMPFMGKKDPEEMPADQVKAMADQADFDGLLMDYKEKGHQVEYAGKEDMEGTPVHKLKVTKKNGDVNTIYIDAETFLELKVTGKTKIQGREIEGETMLGDYKEVGGVIFPHSMEQKAAGMPGGMVMTIEKIEVNPDIPADRFSMPKVEKKPEPAKQ
jgi:outer membrane lipoprotein-sorting protein